MDAKDWTLLVIATAHRPLEPVQLQKSLFLLGKNLKPSQLQTQKFYAFEPYDYGPFSRSIYSDAEALEAERLVIVQRPPETRYRLFRVSDSGAKRALELKSKLSREVSAYLEAVVDFSQSLSFSQLVSAIYKAYPEMKTNSVFQE